MARKAWKSPAPAPGVGMDGDILFSNFIVVFQLQKEMREGVCAHLYMSSFPRHTHTGAGRGARA